MGLFLSRLLLTFSRGVCKCGIYIRLLCIAWSTCNREISHNSERLEKWKYAGRPTIVTAIVVTYISQRMDVIPKIPLRRLSVQTNLSLGSCRKACKKLLHLHPYKRTVAHELLPPDLHRRIQYCEWFNKVLSNGNILNTIFFRDEAWFYLSGCVNSQSLVCRNPSCYCRDSVTSSEDRCMVSNIQKKNHWSFLSPNHRCKYWPKFHFILLCWTTALWWVTIWVFPSRWWYSAHCAKSIRLSRPFVGDYPTDTDGSLARIDPFRLFHV